MGDFNREKNRAVWFDIPVVDLDRAADFYAKVLAVEVDIHTMDDFRFGVIEHSDGNGGCLVPNADEVTADKGILLYLNVHGRIRDAIRQVEQNGGGVLQELQSIGPHGFRAIVRDSEGNRIVLHSDDDA